MAKSWHKWPPPNILSPKLPMVNILAKNPYLFPTPFWQNPYFFPVFTANFRGENWLKTRRICAKRRIFFENLNYIDWKNSQISTDSSLSIILQGSQVYFFPVFFTDLIYPPQGGGGRLSTKKKFPLKIA